MAFTGMGMYLTKLVYVKLLHSTCTYFTGWNPFCLSVLVLQITYFRIWYILYQIIYVVKRENY